MFMLTCSSVWFSKIPSTEREIVDSNNYQPSVFSLILMAKHSPPQPPTFTHTHTHTHILILLVKVLKEKKMRGKGFQI